MANLQKFTAQESANVDSSGVWTTGKAEFSAVNTTDTVHVDVSSYHSVTIDCDGAFQVSFTAGEGTDIVIADTISYAASTISIKVPHGLGKTIAMNLLAASASNDILYVLH